MYRRGEVAPLVIKVSPAKAAGLRQPPAVCRRAGRTRSRTLRHRPLPAHVKALATMMLQLCFCSGVGGAGHAPPVNTTTVCTSWLGCVLSLQGQKSWRKPACCTLLTTCVCCCGCHTCRCRQVTSGWRVTT